MVEHLKNYAKINTLKTLINIITSLNIRIQQSQKHNPHNQASYLNYSKKIHTINQEPRDTQRKHS